MYSINKQQAKEIEASLKKCNDAKIYKRLKALDMRSKGVKSAEIAKATGFHPKYLSNIVSKYMKEGIDAILNDKRGHHSRKMSIEDEKKFLQFFKNAAKNGQVITVREMRQKYDEITGGSAYATIYGLLRRNGWQKGEQQKALQT